ncbi:MAG: HAMP domain-containing protein [Xanthomonadales bacterium]|jgi:signal transduction histidine kinase|nr:HAMP domain-containing protein [Xanthomonadales bacterium]
MTAFWPNMRGLIVKLAVFYLLLSIPILILVESTVLMVEFRHLMQEVEQGALRDTLAEGAGEISDGLSPRNFSEAPWIAWLDAWLIRMQIPGKAFSTEASYVLSELSREPLAAAFYAGDGELVAQAPPYRERPLQLPSPQHLLDAKAQLKLNDTVQAIDLPGSDEPLRLRRVLIPVTDENRLFVGWLYLEMRVPHPWEKILGDISVEWPIVMIYLVVFAIASSAFLTTYVTRRLKRITHAATAWSRGDFSQSIGDHSPDELGALSLSLDQMAEQLRDLMHSRTQLATLKERQRLARDLHDTVKQKAFVLNLQLAALAQKTQQQQHHDDLLAAQQLCHQIQGELSTLLDELRNDDRTLPRRLQLQIDEWREYSGIETRIQCDEIPAVDAAIADQLLRICEEALSNVLRHSGASQIRVNLHHHASRLLLTISDNGNGNASEHSKGMGLRNMRERASQLPLGQCRVEGTPGQGTRIEVECELRVVDV